MVSQVVEPRSLGCLLRGPVSLVIIAGVRWHGWRQDEILEGNVDEMRRYVAG